MDNNNSTEKSKDGKTVLPYSTGQRTFIIISGIIELAVLIPFTLFALVFGYQGFIRGEMGNMIGMFAIGVLLFLLPYSAARILGVYGIWKRKKWGAVLTIISALLIMAFMIVPLFEISLLAIGLIVYGVLLIRAGIKCHTAYTK